MNESIKGILGNGMGYVTSGLRGNARDLGFLLHKASSGRVSSD